MSSSPIDPFRDSHRSETKTLDDRFVEICPGPKKGVSFHGRFLRPGNFWLQNRASLRNAARRVLVENT